MLTAKVLHGDGGLVLYLAKEAKSVLLMVNASGWTFCVQVVWHFEPAPAPRTISKAYILNGKKYKTHVLS